MPNITIGFMDKKINSTKDTFGGTTLSCKLKEPCSMAAPVFQVQGLSKGNFYNYCSFEGRKYYVTDIIYKTNDIQEVHCALDALATYKTDIKSTTGFINFGPKSLAHPAQRIIDSRFCPDLLYQVRNVNLDDFDPYISGTGTVIMRVVDFPVGGVPGSGGVQTICGTLSDWNQLLDQYCTDLDTEIQHLGTNFEKLMGKIAGLGNALDSIKSAIWIPFPLSDFHSGVGYGGNIGGYNFPAGTQWYWVNKWSGEPITHTTQYDDSPPLYCNDYPWLYTPNYMKIMISTPYGSQEIGDSCFNYSSVNDVSLSIRLGYNIEGDCFLDVREVDSGTKLAFHKFNVSVDLKDFIYKAVNSTVAGIGAGIKIGVAGCAAIATGGAALSAAGSAIGEGIIGEAGLMAGKESVMNFGLGMQKVMSGSDLTSEAKAISNGIRGAIAAMDCSVDNKTMGGLGGGVISLFTNSSDWHDIIRIQVKYYLPRIITQNKYEDFCNEYGWPILNYGDMSVDGPYVMAGASCAADAPPEILATINSTINSGIYIE